MPKPKLIESPERLLEIWEGYRVWVKQNPRKKHVFVGKDGSSEYELLERPLTMEGFKVYCFENHSCINHYFENTDKRYNEYSEVCSHIKQIIRQDQIEGGMVGQYNPSITQRINGLTDKQDITSNGKDIGDIKVNIVKSE